MAHDHILLGFILLLNILVPSFSDDSKSLLKFKETLKDDSSSLSSWTPLTTPCFKNNNNWVGIVCSRGGNIWGLRLENMRLSGSNLDVDSLSELTRLRSVSFINNSFGGFIPDFRKLKSVKSIFLSYNDFDGSIDPGFFVGMRRLRKLHLAFNKFSGEIPNSLTTLPRLVELRLEGNQFQGLIPDFKFSSKLDVFNVSNNQLNGPVPASLAKFDSSAFAGNKELCGSPLNTCSPPSNQQNSTSHQSSSEPTPTSDNHPPGASTSDKPIPIIAIVAGVLVALVLAILIILMVLRNRCDKPKDLPGRTTARGREKADHDGSNRSTSSGREAKSESGKLTFVKNDGHKFDLPDLLKAAAEILGSGCFGSSYKATLNDGNSVVVKRFKQMNNVGREEFHEHMRRLGRLSHPNLLPLVAYYYRKQEKLFITEPMQNGSLVVHLHGQTRGKPALNWPTRLKIIKGVAKGLSYLYDKLPSLVAPHGHLKSSNVLLNGSFEPVLTDYGLIPLINQESVQDVMVIYKSPEYTSSGRITKKTDIWALGILIIEILTSKFPSIYLQQGSEVDVKSWIGSVVDEGFDKNMGETKNSVGEMQKLLKIGIACCEGDMEKRLDIKEACERIEEVREEDNNNDFSSTQASTEAEVRSSKGTSDDFTTNIG